MRIVKEYLEKHKDNFIVIPLCDLSTKTWIHRGGIVKLYIEPLTKESLTAICRLCYKTNIDFLVVGHTSNMYFKKHNIPEVIVSTRKLSSWEFVSDENKIKCQPGVIMKHLAAYCNKMGISGFSGFIDLPGTVAGATVNNSSCFGSRVSDILESCTILAENGDVKVLQYNDLLYSHRNSAIKQKIIRGVILEVIFKVEYLSAELLLSKAVENHKKRLETQEGPRQNLGSTFAEIVYRKEYSFILSQIKRIANIFRSKRPIYWQKRVLLLITGFNDINRYISDVNLNCFIWRNDKADIKFDRYLKFIDKISISSRLEIEVIGKNL